MSISFEHRWEKEILLSIVRYFYFHLYQTDRTTNKAISIRTELLISTEHIVKYTKLYITSYILSTLFDDQSLSSIVQTFVLKTNLKAGQACDDVIVPSVPYSTMDFEIFCWNFLFRCFSIIRWSLVIMNLAFA